MRTRCQFHAVIVFAAILTAAPFAGAEEYVRHSEPKTFSYDELVQLSLNQPLSPELAANAGHHPGAFPVGRLRRCCIGLFNKPFRSLAPLTVPPAGHD
jgi:hypothetical protein